VRAVLAGMSTQVDAQSPGAHPAYLHAIRDLRQARGVLIANIGEPARAAAANFALPQIDAAISDLQSASRLDAKSLGDVPPPKSMAPEGRFHEVQALLDSAHNDIKMPESDPVARPYKDRALGHIDSASGAIKPLL
jgi:hypothetical protein